MGCGSGSYLGVPFPNQLPTVSVTQYPSNQLDPSTYVCEIRWSGQDADGRVLAFRYAIDPPAQSGSDTTWIETTANRQTFTFAADSVAAGLVPTGRRYHTFVVVAMDDRGARSVPAHVSFDATTIAPSVHITSPRPSTLLLRQVSPAFRVTWQGSDPDGVTSHLPAQYRWRLFSESSTPSLNAIRQNPDTLRTLFAPRFAGWDSLGGADTSLVLRDLTPGQAYLFALVAIDRAGAWSPVLSLDENLLQFDVEAAATSGPRVTLRTEFLSYEFASGGVILDTSAWPNVDFASGSPVSIGWSAVSPSGSLVLDARWAVDLASIDDESPRTDENLDIHHWSRWSTSRSFDVLGLAPPAGSSSATFRFYLEVRDDAGQVSLVGALVNVVRPTFARSLLIVDDTFLRVDRAGAGGCAQPPSLAWPTAAELDTFLYATGGVPWRCYPAGTLSSPGLFAGYDFDTVGTHFSRLDDFGLSLLGRYRNILWIVDGESATSFDGIFNTSYEPMPLFRFVSQPGVQNPLISWMRAGGRLWLMGGGAGYASNRDYSVIGDAQNVFRSDNGELVPGRFMSSYTHWRSEFTTYRSFQARRSNRAVGGWPGAPDYSQLPPTLLQKSPATDPLPPQRTGQQFYATLFYSEYLSKPNIVREHLPGLPADSLASALDTLYETVGGQSGTGFPLMTVYHGSENSQVIFSGFPLWYFRRDQAIQVTDFVLQRMWGLTRRPIPR
ncbi:MAG: hypothetical protein IT347_10965 [Candidatus Eisenbacteria bacterium]|nr:hypothetical protein [Candidatus Eisenbacteria bacterium]